MPRRKEYTIEELEERYLAKLDSEEMVPFGYMNSEWEEFKAKVYFGGKIIRQSDSKAAWDNMYGRAEYFLVRDGKAIECLLTEMS